MTEQANPLLANAKLPGRIFQLPSRGLFYTHGELDDSVKNGEVHVQPMSALDEIIMKNPDQLFSGNAVETVFKTCVRGVNRPMQLLSKDVDAITMFLRVVTYGPMFDFSVKHTCPQAKEHSYTANLDEMIVGMKMIDPTTVKTAFSVTLPNGQLVQLRPNRYADVIQMVKDNHEKHELTAQDMQRNLKALLLSVIESVDGVTDPRLIGEWLEQLQVTWANRIIEKLDGLNEWGPTMRWQVACKDCGEQFDVQLPLNPVSFFTE
jgi:hypothetical protein